MTEGLTEPEIRTPRLLLRRWRESDRARFAVLNADARVMEHFPTVLSRDESDDLAGRIEKHFATHGFGPWAAELLESDTFIGFIGLAVPPFKAHFTPCVEIGWRLAAETWAADLRRKVHAQPWTLLSDHCNWLRSYRSPCRETSGRAA